MNGILKRLNKDNSINDFVVHMTELWDQLALMESNLVTTDATTFTVYREETRLAQFLMALL